MVTGRITWSRPQDRAHDESVALGHSDHSMKLSVDVCAAADADEDTAAYELMHLPGGEVETGGVVEREHPMLCRKSGSESIVHAPSVTDRAAHVCRDEQLGTVDPATFGLCIPNQTAGAGYVRRCPVVSWCRSA